MRVLLIVFVCLQSAWGGWEVHVFGEDGKGRAGKVGLTYRPGDGGSLDGALKRLVERRKMLLLDSISLEILKDDAMNQRLVKALEKHAGKETKDLGAGIWRGSFHHPDVWQFRQQLGPALVSMEPFDALPGALAKHGLKIGRSGCEKFSFERVKGEIRVTGMGIWLGVEPVDFGMSVREDGIEGWLSLSQLFREGDEWVGIFRMGHERESGARFYGRWSPEHNMYVVEKYRMGWTEGVTWSASAWPVIPDCARTFRLKKGTRHWVRIGLGSESHPRTSVRVFGVRITLDSEEFILGEQSNSYREEER